MMNIIKFIKKKFHRYHDYEIKERSKYLRLDEMGYPLQLCTLKCKYCDKSMRMYVDVPLYYLKGVEKGKYILLK